MAISKRFRYEVLNGAGIYLGDYNDVMSDPNFTQDLNSGGSQMVITRAVDPLNFGEGGLVAFHNKINVYAIDNEAPTGIKIFSGYISAYRPVLDAGDNHVEITVLGYGAELSQFILSSSNSVDVSQTTHNQTTAIGGVAIPLQSWTTGSSVSNLTRIDCIIDTLTATVTTTVTISVFQDDGTNNPFSVTPILGTASVVIPAGTAAATYSFFFSTIALLPNTLYWMEWTKNGSPFTSSAAAIASNSTSVYANGTLADLFSGKLTQDAYFITYASTGSTQYSFNNVDVGTIFSQILDSYIGQGGTLTYTAGVSVQTTGTTATITLNAVTILDALNKCINLAPPGWYWYVDQKTNTVHFHPKSHDATATFTFGKDILGLNLEKTLDKTANTIYMTGGPTNGVNLFRKYVNTASVSKYGQLIMNYSDTNITASGTADTIGATLLGNFSSPTIRSTLTVLDSAAGGFDIESLTPGQIINVAGVSGSGTISLWDVSKWDEDFWDFNIADLQSINMQITRLAYAADQMQVDVQVIPPQITNQTTSLVKSLAQTQNLNNPAIPTTVSS